MSVALVCLDMAGTTVADDGVVIAAFEAAMQGSGVSPESEQWRSASAYVHATMGQSKIAVFTHIFGEVSLAERANGLFEEAYGESVAGGQIAEIPGARAVLDKLRSRDVRICLTTGFSPITRDQIIDALGWGEVADLVLSPADAGRGRPWPDMIWTAALRLQAGAMSEVAVVGDTPSDVEAGCRSGAGLVVGVLSGAGKAEELHQAGAHQVIDDVTGLLDLA